MAGLQFPDSPNPGEIFQGWTWDGVKWVPVPLEPGQEIQAGPGLGIDSTTTPETIYLMVPVSIAMGGTGQTNAADALTALGGVNASYVANAVAPYLPLSGGTVTGSLTVEGSLQADNGRVTSASANNEPSFNMWDPAINTGGGLYSEVGTGRISFGILDVDGNVLQDLGGMDRAGNFVAATSVQCDGVYFTDNDGWFYTPQGVWCADIQAHGISSTNINIFDSWGVCYDESCPWGTNNAFVFGWNWVPGMVRCSINGGAAVLDFGNDSDARLKANIKPSAFDCLSVVEKIPLFEFDWKRVDNLHDLKSATIDEGMPHVPVGIVAQELHKVFPQGVIAGDESEDVLGKIWQPEQNVLIATLIGAVQQLIKRVEELEAR